MTINNNITKDTFVFFKASYIKFSLVFGMYDASFTLTLKDVSLDIYYIWTKYNFNSYFAYISNNNSCYTSTSVRRFLGLGYHYTHTICYSYFL